MDAELTIVLAGGLLVVAALVGLLVKQRMQQARAGGPPSRGPSNRGNSGRGASDRRAPSSRAPRSAARTPTPRPRPPEPTSQPKRSDPAAITHEALAAEGKHEEAARMAMRQGQWSAAMMHYLAAEQPANAAHCAKHAGLDERAAALYEEAGELAEAAECWERAGMRERADKIRGQLAAKRAAAPPPDDAAERRASIEEPLQAALAAGQHARAAELYENAGLFTEAAQQWVLVARRAANPLPFVDRIEKLSPTVCHRFLELESKARPMSKSYAELHYRLALSYAQLGEPEGARDVLERLVAAVGDYRSAKLLLRDPTKVARTQTLPSTPSANDGPMDLLADARVVQARDGPSIEELRGMLADQPCDLGNIEVFYRLGLACLARGTLEDARAAFSAVADVSPGYRDADKRLEQIRARLEAGN